MSNTSEAARQSGYTRTSSERLVTSVYQNHIDFQTLLVSKGAVSMQFKNSHTPATEKAVSALTLLGSSSDTVLVKMQHSPNTPGAILWFGMQNRFETDFYQSAADKAVAYLNNQTQPIDWVELSILFRPYQIGMVQTGMEQTGMEQTGMEQTEFGAQYDDWKPLW